MNLKSQIIGLKEDLIVKIRESALNAETYQIVSHSKVLEETENLLRQYEGLERKFKNLKNRSFRPNIYLSSHKSDKSDSITVIDDNIQSAKEKGEQRRQKIIKEIYEKYGEELFQIKGVKYRSSKYNLIGIASASERSPNRWFLGLPPDEYEIIIFICEKRSGRMFQFILEHNFVSKYLPYFYRGSDGQIKFNLTKKGENFYIQMKESNQQKISHMLDKFENLL